MMPFLTDQYANASSSHHFGKSVKKAVDDALGEIADLINCELKNLVITSGATESINLAIKGLAFGTKSKRKKIVTVTTEHKAVLDTCGYLETIGFDVIYVPVQKDGLIDEARLRGVIDENTLLVSVMHANNETGVLQDIESICTLSKSNGAYFFTDATQTVGKVSVDVEQLGVDGLCFSAHKFYGPKGVGGLYLSDAAKKETQPLIHGGGHQQGLRSGTLNSPGIIGLAKACAIAAQEMKVNESKIRAIRDEFEADALKYPGSFVNGHVEKRLYNTSNICFPGQDANVLIDRLKNVALSNGSACSSMIVEPSHVLTAMGLSVEEANASFRVSIPNGNNYVTLNTLFKYVK
jgi:cysteine desulfurase